MSETPTKAQAPDGASRPHALWALWRYSAVVAILALTVPGLARGADIPRELHPWGRFEPGAWKLVRTVTETFQENRTLVSETETKTTLEEVGDGEVTLRVEVVVRVAGKRFSAEPQLIGQGFHGERTDQEVTITELPPDEVTIQGRTIPCEVLQLEIVGTARKTVSKIYLSRRVEPFVLRRESVKTDLEGESILGKTTVEVTAIDVPCRIRIPGRIAAQIINTSHMTMTHEYPQGKTVTRTVMSAEIPGGVVYQTSREFDGDNNLVRCSLLELIDYGLAPTRRSGWLFQWRPLRRRGILLPTPTPSAEP